MKNIIKKNSIFCIILLFNLTSFSQVFNIKNINQGKIEKNNRKIEKLFKRSECYTSDYKIINILYMGYFGIIDKKNFRDTSFLNYINQDYENTKYLGINSYIGTNNGNLIALSYYNKINCKISSINNEQLFYSKLIELNPKYVFYIINISFNYCFIIKQNNEIYILRRMKNNNVVVLDFDDFINNYWEQFSSGVL